MIELLILLALAYCLRGWIATPTEQDCMDWIVVSEFDIGEEVEDETCG